MESRLARATQQQYVDLTQRATVQPGRDVSVEEAITQWRAESPELSDAARLRNMLAIAGDLQRELADARQALSDAQRTKNALGGLEKSVDALEAAQTSAAVPSSEARPELPAYFQKSLRTLAGLDAAAFANKAAKPISVAKHGALFRSEALSPGQLVVFAERLRELGKEKSLSLPQVTELAEGLVSGASLEPAAEADALLAALVGDWGLSRLDGQILHAASGKWRATILGGVRAWPAAESLMTYLQASNSSAHFPLVDKICLTSSGIFVREGDELNYAPYHPADFSDVVFVDLLARINEIAEVIQFVS